MKKLSMALFLVAGIAVQMLAQTVESVDVSNAPEGFFTADTREYKIEGNVVKGQKDGVWYELYKDNSRKDIPKKIVTYAKGKREGLYMELDNTGSITKKANYRNDELDGFLYTWYKGGYPALMQTYKNGALAGKHIKYYDRAGVQEESEYLNGLRHGVTTWFDDSGHKKMSITYNNGEFEGPQQTYYHDGTVKSVKEYKNNVLNGTAKEFYEDGSLKSEAVYKDGQMKGKEKKYPEPKKEEKDVKKEDVKSKKQ